MSRARLELALRVLESRPTEEGPAGNQEHATNPQVVSRLHHRSMNTQTPYLVAIIDSLKSYQRNYVQNGLSDAEISNSVLNNKDIFQ